MIENNGKGIAIRATVGSFEICRTPFLEITQTVNACSFGSLLCFDPNGEIFKEIENGTPVDIWFSYRPADSVHHFQGEVLRVDRRGRTDSFIQFVGYDRRLFERRICMSYKDESARTVAKRVFMASELAVGEVDIPDLPLAWLNFPNIELIVATKQIARSLADLGEDMRHFFIWYDKNGLYWTNKLAETPKHFVIKTAQSLIEHLPGKKGGMCTAVLLPGLGVRQTVKIEDERTGTRRCVIQSITHLLSPNGNKTAFQYWTIDEN